MVDYIADIGKNFIDSTDNNQTVEGCLLRAKRLVFMAKQSGATVAKFQVHVAKDELEKRNRSRKDWIERNEGLTPFWFWKEVKDYCDYLGIEFLVTPMSLMAAGKIMVFSGNDGLVKRWKVSSADITDFNLLDFLKETKKPVILSTGMSTLEQIDKAIKFLGNQIQFINYCVSLYPCPVHKINLENLIKLKAHYNLPVGFSDHSLSVEAPALAIRMGAVAVEKHFTLDRNAFGPDHKVSLLPQEFKEMVDLCKLAETDGESFEQEKTLWPNFRAS